MAPRDARDVLRRLRRATAPYGLRAERTEFSLLPDLVLLHPLDGRPVARLRFIEPEHGSPEMHSLYPPEVSSAEQAEIEAHLAQRMAAVIAEAFSYTAWMSLPDLPGASPGAGRLGPGGGASQRGYRGRGGDSH